MHSGDSSLLARTTSLASTLRRNGHNFNYVNGKITKPLLLQRHKHDEDLVVDPPKQILLYTNAIAIEKI